MIEVAGCTTKYINIIDIDTVIVLTNDGAFLKENGPEELFFLNDL